MKTNNAGTGFVGVPIGEDGKPIEGMKEEDHFYVCASCKQAVDKRDLGQVFHHEEPGHEPLELNS